MQLFGDIGAHKGGVLRVTRFGLAQMTDSAQKGTLFPEDDLARIRGSVLHRGRRCRGRVRMHHLSGCIILGQSTRIGTGAYMVARRLMIDPSDLAAKKIVFEEGYVMTLEFNTPFLTHRVALSKAFFFSPRAGSPVATAFSNRQTI